VINVIPESIDFEIYNIEDSQASFTIVNIPYLGQIDGFVSGDDTIRIYTEDETVVIHYEDLDFVGIPQSENPLVVFLN